MIPEGLLHIYQDEKTGALLCKSESVAKITCVNVQAFRGMGIDITSISVTFTNGYKVIMEDDAKNSDDLFRKADLLIYNIIPVKAAVAMYIPNTIEEMTDRQLLERIFTNQTINCHAEEKTV